VGGPEDLRKHDHRPSLMGRGDGVNSFGELIGGPDPWKIAGMVSREKR
jgi:hypothetical protein